MRAAHFSPRKIVSELNRYIVGQDDAKRAVAIAMRNRWRRTQLPEGLKEEIVPKNILMIGPTGCGKTEIARRLARLAEAPFLKIEATKFTEVGYVGRDVDSIIRDLVDSAVVMLKDIKRKDVQKKAQSEVEKRILDAIAGKDSSKDTKEKFRKMLREGKLEDKEIDIAVADTQQSVGHTEIPGVMSASVINIGDMMKNFMDKPAKQKKLKVSTARKCLEREEVEKLLDQESLVQEALSRVENNGIVFLDEIDKVCARTSETGTRGGEISREGVQRDLLPLIEGTTVSTKHGPVKTDHILFIASGAFHLSNPADLLPELQGRLPIRVELEPLKREDLRHILTDPEHSLLKQYKALMETEGVDLKFSDKAIDALVELAANINERVENIGARRLATVLEKLLEDISFTASERKGETIEITPKMVKEKVAPLAEKGDLSRFIL